MNPKREIPNPQSTLLSKAIIGGAGVGLPPDLDIPNGMAAVLLLVPIEELVSKSLPEIQEDIGLPWHAGDGPGVWFGE